MSGPISQFTLNLHVRLMDAAGQWYVPIPTKCKLVDIYCVPDDTVTFADEVLTFRKKTPGIAVATLGGLVLTVVDLDIAGTVRRVVNDQTQVEEIAMYFEEGDSIGVDTPGASTGTYDANISFVFER